MLSRAKTNLPSPSSLATSQPFCGTKRDYKCRLEPMITSAKMSKSQSGKLEGCRLLLAGCHLFAWMLALLAISCSFQLIEGQQTIWEGPRPTNHQEDDAQMERSLSEAANSPVELHRRVKRALYQLPAGADRLLGPQLRTSFSCDNLGYGYYADVDNQCKIFHVCQSFRMSDGSIFNNHWSFMCGEQTIFNQATLSCSWPEDAVPCESARDFYHVNDYFGDLQAPSVRDSDLSAAQDLVSRAYGARLSSSASSSPTSTSSSSLLTSPPSRQQDSTALVE